MATTDSATNIFIEAKSEYTRELISIIKPHIFTGIKSLYDDSRITCKKNNDVSKTLYVFQNQLKLIPQWNQNILNEEVNRIIKTSQCEWLEDLVTAVFISHIKILSSIRGDSSTINLKVPKSDVFIHQCYIEVAREIWKNPYLFLDKGNKLEYMANLREIDTLIAQCINETLRKMLPIKNIVKDYILTGTGSPPIPASPSENILQPPPLVIHEKNSMDKNVMEFINKNRDTLEDTTSFNKETTVIDTHINDVPINNTNSDSTFFIEQDNNIDEFKKIDEAEIKDYFIKDDSHDTHIIDNPSMSDTMNNNDENYKISDQNDNSNDLEDRKMSLDNDNDEERKRNDEDNEEQSNHDDEEDVDDEQEASSSVDNLDIDNDSNINIKNEEINMLKNDQEQRSDMWISSKIDDSNIISNMEQERELELKNYLHTNNSDNDENKIDTIESTLKDFIYENQTIQNDIDDVHDVNDGDIHIHTQNNVNNNPSDVIDVNISNDRNINNLDIHNKNNVDSDNNYESDYEDDMVSIAGGDTYNNRYINNDKIIVQKYYSDINNIQKKVKIITPTHKDKFISKREYDKNFDKNHEIKNIFLLPKNYKKEFKFE